jgi:hypothetical protein
MSFAASNTVGSIYGEAKAGATITFKSDATGLSRNLTADENGKFSFKNVPPGRYTVRSSNGASHSVMVTIGTGSSVIFSGDETEVIEVRGSAISAIDTSSVESSVVFTHEQIELLPVGRNSTAIALLTPGTVPGDDDFGNLPSFGGSSVAENGYYIDGFDVTNIRSFLSFATLPFDAISQTEVKTGGYGAEYGRSLGGVTNTVTKSGTNEWKFAASAYYTPNSLRSDGIDIVDLGQADGNLLSRYSSDDYSQSLSYNIGAGGPIIEDTLFIYANLEFQDVEQDNYSRTSSNSRSTTNPNGIIKLDWYINDDHLVSGTYIQNEEEIDRVFYDHVDEEFYTGKHGEESTRYTEENGGDIMIFNYSGQITDDLSVSLMYGELENLNENKNPRNPDTAAALCPRVFDTRGDKAWGAREVLGCWNTAQSKILDTEPESDRDERSSFKIDVSYTIGDHELRMGYNNEEFTSYTLGEIYTGGVYYRYFESNEATSTSINGVELPVGSQAVRVIYDDQKSGSFKVENTAFYIEDNWQITDDMLLYIGVRNETFTNYAANGEVFVEADELIAPRLGFSWDVDGDSTKKLYGTFGRSYIPIASNTNIRATRQESGSQYYYSYDDIDATTGAPIGLGDKIGGGYTDDQVPDPRVIAVSDLDPMFQDEYILGYQQEVMENWTAGVKFMYREIQDGMDDMCSHDGFYNWGVDQGFAMANADNEWHTPEGGFDVASMSGCLLINPGKDLNLFIDTNGDGEVTAQTVSNDYFNIPEYDRSYKGIELTLEKAFADGWYMNASYVWSQSEGNIEGYVNSTLGQEDAGATQDFDHKRFQDGSQGYLPNDRRHQFKVYGAYQFSDELTVTANINLMSGTPKSCNGFLPTDARNGEAKFLVGDGSTTFDEGNFGRYGASSFYCVNESGESELSNRGDYGTTGWTYMVDAGLSYIPDWADDQLTLKVDVFNIFDFDEATEVDQQKDFARGGSEINPNFGKATNYQAPRSVRFTARYKF